MQELEEMKLARVIDAAGGIDGRVKMQKMVYLLTAMGYDLPFHDFVIRQQGPFSQGVAVSADVLKGAEVVGEEQVRHGKAEDGREVVQYNYSVRQELLPLIRKHFDIPAPAGKPPLEIVAGYLKSKERAVLEVAATRLYLEREDRLSGAALTEELQRLKGHLAWAFAPADRLLEELQDRHWL